MSSDISPVPHSALQQPPPPALKYSGLFRAAGVPPALIPPGDLERLYNDLNIKTREALQRYLATLQRAVNVDETQFEELKREALRVGTLTVTVQGAHGERIVASTGDVLKKEQLPDVISLIVFDSSAALRPYNVTLMNRFTLRLDFTEPPGFDTYSPWDQPTPNNSQLEVVGDDHTWVTAVYESTLEFFRRRGRRRTWLHSHYSFNVLHWLVGFPAALWLIYRIDSSGILSGLHTALKGAIYLYVFLVALFVFRGIIFGFRWMFPLLELEGASSKKTRALVGTILSSLLLALAYDVLRTLESGNG